MMLDTYLRSTPRRAVVVLLVLGTISAIWVESDLYRYCAPFLISEAFILYYVGRYWFGERQPSIGLMGFLCVAWTAQVAIRFLVAQTQGATFWSGSSEGIYLFPLIFPTLGFAFYLANDLGRSIVWIAMLMSAVFLVGSVDPIGVVDGERLPFLFHENTIHASVGGGLLALAALCFALDQTDRRSGPAAQRAVGLTAAALVFVLCLFGLLGAQSKGVWLAMAGTLPALGLTVSIERRRSRAAIPVALTGVAIFVAVFHREIATVLGPSTQSAIDIAARFADNPDPDEIARRMIASGTVPNSFNERLMIWVNAVEIWSHNVWFGTGIHWDALWDGTSFADVGYRLMHNGFLEVAVRYGLLGLAFYGALMVWSLRQAWLCYRRDMLPKAAVQFYFAATLFICLTMLTNSNNRLAIGESFILVAAAFGFLCFYRLQEVASATPPGGDQSSEAIGTRSGSPAGIVPTAPDARRRPTAPPRAP